MPAERRQAEPRAATARVFFALWPPPEIAGRLATVAADFAVKAGGKPARRETIHLTLAFIGDVPVVQLAGLEQAARKVRCAPFTLTLDNVGVWRHNRIFHAGCDVIPAALTTLEISLKGAVQAAGFAVADARRPFVPHVTLVRKVTVPDAALPQCRAMAWDCQEFVLVRSTLSPGGSSYQSIAGFPLAGK